MRWLLDRIWIPAVYHDVDDSDHVLIFWGRWCISLYRPRFDRQDGVSGDDRTLWDLLHPELER